MEVSQYSILNNYNCSIVAGTGDMERTLDKRMEGEMMIQVTSALGTTWMLCILSVGLGS